VMNGFVSLYELPMQVAVLCALALAIVLRLRTWLLIAAAAVSWLACEVALAYHGWGVNPRYVLEPAAVLVVLAGAGVGRVLTLDRRHHVVLRLVGAAAVLALIVTLVPHARIRGRLAHNGIVLGRTWARQLQRLHTVIEKDGGAQRILACGQPVTEVPYQSILAWELGQNVIDVGWEPQVWDRLRLPVVRFEPVGAGWQVRPVSGTFTLGHAAVPASADHSSTDAAFVRSSVKTYFGQHPSSVRTPPASCRRLFANTAFN
jgi:hypothetical protein